VELNKAIHCIFKAKYGFPEEYELFQVPKPIESVLNIFFVVAAEGGKHNLWRL